MQSRCILRFQFLILYLIVLGCDMCQEIRFGDCPAHGPLHAVRPSITLPENQKSYAISTFPEEVGLCLSSIPLAGYGVFARHFIPLGTWIGPYEGLKISVEEGLSRPQQQNFMWEVISYLFIRQWCIIRITENGLVHPLF